MFDVKSVRPSSEAIIAGPLSEAEAKFLAEKYARDFTEWKARKLAEVAAIADDLERQMAARRAQKYIDENETRYEAVPHIPGGI